jgi:hypothetical protein
MLYMSADAANLQAPLAAVLEEIVRPIRETGSQAAWVVAQVETPGGVLKRYDLSDGTARWVASGKTAAVDGFLAWARAGRPADHEALLFWGHSAGPGSALQAIRQPGDLVPEAAVLRKRTWDFGITWIDPHAAAAVSLASVAPVDLLAFDSCYLGSLEVALQCRNRAHWMLAPQSAVGLTGWQFDVMMDAVLADPSITPEALARALLRSVGVLRRCPPTLSLYDLSATTAAEVATKFTALVATLAEALDGKTAGRPEVPPFEARLWVLDAFHRAAWAKVRQFLDLPDLCRRLAAQAPSPALRGAARALLAELMKGTFLLDHVDTTGSGLSGLSVYCPWPRATEAEVLQGARNVEVEPAQYARFDAAGASGWAELLARPELRADAERRAARRQTLEYVAAARAAGGAGTGTTALKPIEMATKPIEMATKPIEMATKPIEMELLGGA